MKRKTDWYPIILGLLLGVMTALVLLAASNYPAYAEEMSPSPEGAMPLQLNGCMELTGAKAEIRIVECLRVDLVRMETDGAWACLTLPKIPDCIRDILLYDGWHLLHGAYERTGENTLSLHFMLNELKTLDGTVGLYLLILAAE